MTTALIILADGAEELETISVSDILARGGVKVTMAALSDKNSTEITCAHGTVIKTPCLLSTVQDQNFDAVIVPGGYQGSLNCQKSKLVKEILKRQQQSGKLIAAICAAPGLVLAHHGIITDEEATGYPGTTDGIRNLHPDKGVVIDIAHHLITGQGPAYAADFGSAVLTVLKSAEITNKVRKGMLFSND